MENANESVTQPVENSVPTENQTTNNVQTSSAVEDYKRDMFKYKQQVKELKEQLDEIALKEETEKGNYQGVINKLKEDLKEAKTELANDRYSFANSVLDDAIAKEALARGIKAEPENNQLEVFMRLVDENAKKAVAFEDGFKVKGEDVQSLVDNHLKRYGNIFNNKVSVVDSPPASKPINKPSNKFDINKASGDDLFKYILDNKDKLK